MLKYVNQVKLAPTSTIWWMATLFISGEIDNSMGQFQPKLPVLILGWMGLKFVYVHACTKHLSILKKEIMIFIFLNKCTDIIIVLCSLV